MTIYTPYTYRITHLPTGYMYYGVRYAKNCNPNELWATYFTSSKLVKKLISEYGTDSFIVEVRKTFTNGSDAVRWESKVLRRLKVVYREDWLNRCDNQLCVPGRDTRAYRKRKKGVYKHPEHVIKKMKETCRRRPVTDAMIERMKKCAAERKNKPGRVWEQTSKDKLRQARSLSWVVVSPEGVRTDITNLKQFCHTNKLSPSHMRSVAMGSRVQHKGWKCEYA